MLKLTRRMALLASGVALAAFLPAASFAETVLRFSHTDSEQGSRQTAALAFVAGELQISPSVPLIVARRSSANRAARPSRLNCG